MKKCISEKNIYVNYQKDSTPVKKTYMKRIIKNEPRTIRYYNGKIFKSQIYRTNEKKNPEIYNDNSNQIKTYGLEINKKYYNKVENNFLNKIPLKNPKKIIRSYVSGNNSEFYLKKKKRISLSGKFLEINNFNKTQERNEKKNKSNLYTPGRLSTNLNSEIEKVNFKKVKSQKVDFKKKFKELKQKICNKINNKEFIDQKLIKKSNDKISQLENEKKNIIFKKFDFKLLINKKIKEKVKAKTKVKEDNLQEKEMISIPSFLETKSKSSKKQNNLDMKKNKETEELKKMINKKNEQLKKKEKKISKLEMDLTITEAEKSGLKLTLQNLNEKLQLTRKKLRNFKNNSNHSESEIEDLRQKNENNQIKIIKYIKEKEEIERNNEKLKSNNNFLKSKINTLLKIKKEFPFSSFSRICDDFLIIKNDNVIKSPLINIFQGDISKKERSFLSELLKQESNKTIINNNFKKNNLIKSVRSYNYRINNKKNNPNKNNEDEYYGDLSHYDSKTEKKSELLNRFSQQKKIMNDEKSSLLDMDISVKNKGFIIKKRCFDQNSKINGDNKNTNRNKSVDLKKFTNNFRKSVGANKNENNEDVYHSIIQSLKAKVKKLKKKDSSRKILKKKKRNLSQNRKF